PHDPRRLRPLKVERQRALAAVSGDKQGREFPGRADRLPAASGNVTAERLDLDDVGALIGEEHRRQWPRDHASPAEHPDTRQRTRHIWLSYRFVSKTYIGLAIEQARSPW